MNGRITAVSLQNNAIVNVAQLMNKYIVFFVCRNSIKNKNDNNENIVRNRSPLAGIHATDDTNKG